MLRNNVKKFFFPSCFNSLEIPIGSACLLKLRCCLHGAVGAAQAQLEEVGHGMRHEAAAGGLRLPCGVVFLCFNRPLI